MNEIGPLVRVQAVEPLKGFNVRITFRDGVEKVVDLEPFLRGEIFAQVRNDPEMFRTVRVVGSTIGWANGADIDPDVLYYDLKPAWMEELATA
jgi:hypothetical protein